MKEIVKLWFRGSSSRSEYLKVLIFTFITFFLLNGLLLSIYYFEIEVLTDLVNSSFLRFLYVLGFLLLGVFNIGLHLRRTRDLLVNSTEKERYIFCLCALLLCFIPIAKIGVMLLYVFGSSGIDKSEFYLGYIKKNILKFSQAI